jgi:hypothetical protein
MTFEPPFEMRQRLTKNKETFAQYVVRVMTYSCSTCGALPGVPCNERISESGSCGVQFHKARAEAARCPVTTHFLRDDQ